MKAAIDADGTRMHVGSNRLHLSVTDDVDIIIDPDVKVDVAMPSAEKGGSTAYLTISTEHPDKFGVTEQD